MAANVRARLKAKGRTLAALAVELGIGAPTLTDILEAMEKPGRDPRDDATPPILRADVLKLPRISSRAGGSKAPFATWSILAPLWTLALSRIAWYMPRKWPTALSKARST